MHFLLGSLTKVNPRINLHIFTYVGYEFHEENLQKRFGGLLKDIKIEVLTIEQDVSALKHLLGFYGDKSIAHKQQNGFLSMKYWDLFDILQGKSQNRSLREIVSNVHFNHMETAITLQVSKGYLQEANRLPLKLMYCANYIEYVKRGIVFGGTFDPFAPITNHLYIVMHSLYEPILQKAMDWTGFTITAYMRFLFDVVKFIFHPTIEVMLSRENSSYSYKHLERFFISFQECLRDPQFLYNCLMMWCVMKTIMAQLRLFRDFEGRSDEINADSALHILHVMEHEKVGRGEELLWETISELETLLGYKATTPTGSVGVEVMQHFTKLATQYMETQQQNIGDYAAYSALLNFITTQPYNGTSCDNTHVQNVVK
ncbi:unnamed protein product [Orchesella dallaii]|uniref:Uncharacterized protein n=1 Tax=Orchesella dallaii TaxID=48710 RepID=A0ABP1QU64_9HEXA